jgi:hypothetical protein
MADTNPQPPLLIRLPAEAARVLAGEQLLVEVATLAATARREFVIGAAAGDPRAAVTAPDRSAIWVARRVLDRLAELSTVERAPRIEQSPALRLIAIERLRQIEAKGYTADHDDQYVLGDLAAMAVWYADQQASGIDWPLDDRWPERRGQLWDLIRAGALIAAEIDRLMRDGWRP